MNDGGIGGATSFNLYRANCNLLMRETLSTVPEETDTPAFQSSYQAPPIVIIGRCPKGVACQCGYCVIVKLSET